MSLSLRAPLLRLLGPVCGAFFAVALPGPAAEPPADAVRHFESKVRPLLLDRCVKCHGPDKQKGGLRLDSAAALARGSTSGPIVRPRDPDHSLLIQAVQPTDEFGRQCLLLAEAGVRFVQVNHAYPRNYWDAHGDLEGNHGSAAAKVDRPIAGLLKDLKARGLLNDTLVVWGTEFGRTPASQGNDGRDHHPHAFSIWMAGGGVKGGTTYGTTDDFGYYVAENKVTINDLHATILHLLGLDHVKLTYRHAGRDFRLTDVRGKVVREVLA